MMKLNMQSSKGHLLYWLKEFEMINVVYGVFNTAGGGGTPNTLYEASGVSQNSVYNMTVYVS